MTSRLQHPSAGRVRATHGRNRRDGSMILSDVRGPTLALACEACGRRGRYNVERLIAEHSDAKLTDLRRALADCPKKAGSASVRDRCKARYDGL
jgi:hypothetical protein